MLNHIFLTKSDILDDTHPRRNTKYGQSIRMAFRLILGPGPLCVALEDLVVMTEFATANRPRLRNAVARTPQAKPIWPLISLLSMIGNMTPPIPVPEWCCYFQTT